MDRLTKDLINKILSENNDILPNFIGDSYPEFIRKTLESIYRKMAPRNWGRINTETCQTGFGVLNVFEHPDEVGGWSILNRFDTNTKVKNKIQEIRDLALLQVQSLNLQDLQQKLLLLFHQVS